MAAGLYSGLTYGLKEARGAHDWVIFYITKFMIYLFCLKTKKFWIFNHNILFCLAQKNSAVAGAATGAALALASENPSHEHVVQCAITGAAISTAANLLTGIF